jgi:crossover junction endodeoxyribonuclease RuvC
VRILGIDPGLQTTGFGVIEMAGHASQPLHYVASGTIRTKAQHKGDLPGRIHTLVCGIQALCERYQPDAAALEIVFVNVNPQSTLLLGQARGACLSGLVLCLPPENVMEYTALQMKKAVVGHGKAAKSQVQTMVKHLLNLPSEPGPDAADALGLAITHAHAIGLHTQLLQAGVTLQRKTSSRYSQGRWH